MEGRESSVGERVGDFKDGITDWKGYAFGAASSPVYRLLRGGATSIKNSVTKSVETGTPTVAAGSFTPKNRQAQVSQAMAEINDQAVSKDPMSRAYRVVAKALDKDGISQEDLIGALDNFRYAGYSSVDEMLFEVASASTNDKGAGKVNELVRALATVGGDAQAYGRTQAQKRAAGAGARIRDDIRAAAGLDGTDFDSYATQLEEAAYTLPRPLYDAAYDRKVSNNSFRTLLLPLFKDSPQAREAIRDASDYAIASAFDRHELAVARRTADELDRFASEIDAVLAGKMPENRVQNLSTRAYDFIDRMLTDKSFAVRHGDKRIELSRGYYGAIRRLRAVVDPQTGLGDARSAAAELKVAAQALDFGVKASKNSVAMRDIQREFRKEMERHALSDIDILEGPTINSALLMGYVRGAEDIIEKASNPSTAIRQLFGSERQRDKMKQMLSGLDETMIARAGVLKAKNKNLSYEEIAKMVAKERANASTGSSPETKRLRQVVGDKYKGNSKKKFEEGDVRTVGRPAREMRMIENMRDLFQKSPTGRNNAAVAEVEGNQRLAETLAEKSFRYAGDMKAAGRDAVVNVVRRATAPAIYNKDVNRELGNILFTGGEDSLRGIIDELAKYRKGVGAVSGDATQEIAETLAKGPKAAGVPGGGAVTETAVGAVAGGSVPVDYDGDGEVTIKDRTIGAGIGATGAATVGKIDRAVRHTDRGTPTLRKAGNDLPMDEPSRMTRAKEMGFDTDQTFYHGTRADFDEFQPSKEGSFGQGVYLTSNPQTAGAHANGPSIDGAKILPLLIRNGKYAEKDLVYELYEEISAARPKLTHQQLLKRTQKEMRRRGYTGVKHTYSNGHVEVTVFDPKDIRSKNAKFDPSETNSPILTAGIGGRRRKDVMRDLRGEEGRQFPSERSPTVGRRPTVDDYTPEEVSALREDLVKAGVVGAGVVPPAVIVAYSWYASEQYKKNKPTMSLQEFMEKMDSELRGRQALPSAPSLKPQTVGQ
ncbi:MAG: hypothetical protein AAFW60_01830 [Pseudomonadota bacterium]